MLANAAEAILSGGRPDDPAILHGDRRLNFAELRAAVCGWGQLLAAADRGARVGLLAENGPFFVAAYLGAIRAGLCAVPLPTDCSEAAFSRIVASTGIKRLLVSARLHGRISPWANRLGIETLMESPVPPQADPWSCPPADVDPRADLAAIMWTSGSTGEPKGVMVTHHNILVNTADIVGYTGIGRDDRVMAILPFHYCFGTSLLHTHLMAGGSLVINNRFLFPEKVLDEMQEKSCTGFAGVPATYQILLRKTRFSQRQFPALRWLQQAGGRLPSPLIQEIRKAHPTVKLFVMYGQTEATARLSYLPPDRLDDKLGSIGRGLPHTRLEVLKADGVPVTPGSDEVGEIVASGENITPGYWADPAETARYFRDGRLHTGDMARVDGDGFLFVVERARDFIKPMGHRVSPKEIEEVLAELPEVVEAAVIGVPDELWGEAIKAYVVIARAGQLDVEQVKAHCLKRLPNYKVPQHVEFVAALPKTVNGKVDKGTLRCKNKSTR
ncbi:MAG: AMP-binding protein [Planctomycetaceae bacterium]|nr:AMP-binding protein [Planctomycetaceae bacterium]